MNPIFLLTDFGLRDPYVGILRAVIASIAPRSPIHDLGHDLPPQDLRAAAYALASAAPYLPDGAVVCAVVDPGVGSERRPIAARFDSVRGTTAVIAPDNGLLTPLLEGEARVSAVALDEPRYRREPVSATFHGRDIFAPAAAHLAAGAPFDRLGSALDAAALTRLPWPAARRDGADTFGEVVSVDRFGNLISNVLPDPSAVGSALQRRRWRVSVAGLDLPLQRTFADVGVGEPVAYLGSTGRVEVALRDGSAAERFGVGVGATLRLAGPVGGAQAAGDGSD